MSRTSVAQATDTSTPLVVATRVWLRRRARLEHPAGTFDSARRWSPDPEEERPCCRRIRRPSRAWPFSLLTHCRSLAHVAARHEVEDLPALRRAIREYAGEWAQEAAPRPHAITPHAALVSERTITPEETLRQAGINDARQAEYQRNMSMLLAGPP